MNNITVPTDTYCRACIWATHASAAFYSL